LTAILRQAGARSLTATLRHAGAHPLTATLRQARVTSTLVHALLDPAKPLTTHYGAVAGLRPAPRPPAPESALTRPRSDHDLTTI
jgi:hypothetical protein